MAVGEVEAYQLVVLSGGLGGEGRGGEGKKVGWRGEGRRAREGWRGEEREEGRKEWSGEGRGGEGRGEGG